MSAGSRGTVVEAWREALSRPGFRVRLAICAVTFPICAATFARFVAWVEHRPGVVLVDPILERLPTVDLTWLTFGLLYPAIIVAFASLLREPERLLLGVQTYGVMLLVRLVAMWTLPLEPPPTIIPLVDPFAQLLLGGQDAPPTRDLFFSGHTATLTVLYLSAKSRWVRTAVLGATAVIIVAMLLQHVHYAVDILVAPFVVFGIHRVLRPWGYATSSSEPSGPSR